MAEITSVQEYEKCTNPLDIESINIIQQQTNFSENMNLDNIKKYKKLKKIYNRQPIFVIFSNIDIISQIFDDIHEIDCNFIVNKEHINLKKNNKKNAIYYIVTGGELKDDSILNHLPQNLNTLIISNNTYCGYNNLFKAGLQNLPSSLKNIIFCQQLCPGSYYITDTHRSMKFILKSKLPYDCKIYLSDKQYSANVPPYYEVINNGGILTAVSKKKLLLVLFNNIKKLNL